MRSIRTSDERERAAQVWDRMAGGARFAHPLDAGRLASWVPRGEAVLDLGCGYGRLTRELAALGYRRVIGVDPSAAMVERGRREAPGIDLRQASATELPFEVATFGAVLAFTLFTSLPDDQVQERVLAEVRRVLRPGGVLVVSDLPLQSDRRNQARYRRDVAITGRHGVFELDSGVRLRHHDEDWFERLTRDYELLERRDLPVRTMRGNPARARQLFLRRPLAPRS